MKLSDSPPLYAMIARDSSRITMVDPDLKRQSTYRLPEDARPAIIDPVDVGNDLFAVSRDAIGLGTIDFEIEPIG